MRKLVNREDLREEEKVLSRFGSMCYSREGIEASKNFRKVLELCLKLGESKR